MAGAAGGNGERRNLAELEALADELIETIHAALLGETGWQSFIDRLNAIAPGALSTLFFHDAAGKGGAVAYLAGIEGRETALAAYEAYYSKRNPWMRRVAATPLGTGIIGEQIVPRDAFNGSEYYNDYVRPNGLETGIGLTIFKDERCYFVLSTLTDDRDIDRNLARAGLFTRIAPALDRAFRYYRSDAYRAAAMELGDGIAAAENLGLLLVDDAMRVVKASPLGESALSAGNVVGLGPLGRVRLCDPGAQAVLQAMLDRRAGGASGDVHTDARLGIRLIRVGGTAAAQYFAGPMVAILIGDAAGRPVIDASQLARLYSLTPAELRVVSAIVAGDGITRIAEAAGVSRETVRSQLKSVYAKTGTHSQADIVRLAGGLAWRR